MRAEMTSLRLRAAAPTDAGVIVAALEHPREGYGPSSLVGLEPLLARLLAEGALRGPIIEARAPDTPVGRGKTRGVALTGFVSLEQAGAWLREPTPHLVDVIIAREEQGQPLLLRPQRVGELNAGEGLALVFVLFQLVTEDEATMAAVVGGMFHNFRLFHAGYQCPLALHPGGTERGNQSLGPLGFRPVGDGSRIWVLRVADLADAPYTPFVVLRRRPAPTLGFSPGERELLMRAIVGSTDTESATALGISVETVRKRWRSVFERVARMNPALLPRSDGEEAKRGPEKRGALLQYLDEHLEELRPYGGA
jgi:DNA-binding CsgD family transcriptional regulator